MLPRIRHHQSQHRGRAAKRASEAAEIFSPTPTSGTTAWSAMRSFSRTTARSPATCRLAITRSSAGLTAVHQFCRIGRFAITGGCSKIVQDVPPFMIADGNPAKVRGINQVGSGAPRLSAGKDQADQGSVPADLPGENEHRQALEAVREKLGDERGSAGRFFNSSRRASAELFARPAPSACAERSGSEKRRVLRGQRPVELRVKKFRDGRIALRAGGGAGQSRPRASWRSDSPSSAVPRPRLRYSISTQGPGER